MSKVCLLTALLLLAAVNSAVLGTSGSSGSSTPVSYADTTVLERAKDCQFLRLRYIQKAGESLAQCLTRLAPSYALGVNSTIRSFSNIIKTNITNTLSNAQSIVNSRANSIINQTQSQVNTLTNIISATPIMGARGILMGNRSTGVNEIQDMFDSYNTHPTIPDLTRTTTMATGNVAGKTCAFQGIVYSHPTNVFLHVDRSSNVYPGSLLQSANLKGVLSGTNQQVTVPVTSDFKNPQIKILDHLNVNTLKVSYETDSINKALSGAISSSINLIKDNNVFYEIGTSDDLADFADRLNFNPSLFKKLGLYRQPGSPLTHYTKKIIIFFTKSIGTYEFLIESPDTKLPNTPFYTVFNSKLTMAEALKKNPSCWSYNNPPVYIDSVTYGSMIFLTVDYNTVTAPLYDSLGSAANQGPNFLQPIMKEIASQPSLKTFSLGPYTSLDLSTLKTGNWIDYLFTIPSKPSAEMIQPLLYSTKDFTQKRYNSANAFEFCKICTNPISSAIPAHTYSILLENILSYAPVLLKAYSPDGKQILNLSIISDVNFDLTPFFSNTKLKEMKVVIRPTVGTCVAKGCYKQSVTASFIVDSVIIPKLQISCQTNCVQRDAGTYTVPADGRVTP